MTVPLFHPNNTFSIYYKNHKECKTIDFSGNKVCLYYKLYSILRKKNKYLLSTATVKTPTDCVLMKGSFFDIYEALLEELLNEHKYTIISNNSDGDEVYHWRNDLGGVLGQLTQLKEKFASSGDHRLLSQVVVIENEKNKSFQGNLDYLIELFSTQKVDEPESPGESELNVYLNFEEVLQEMRPLILNGTDKEKIEAKAILAYVATKLASK